MICHFCNKQFTTTEGFSRHLSYTHKVIPKEYYDTYINVEDGKCLICGKQTTFISLSKGYRKFCSTSCATTYQHNHYTEEQLQQSQMKRILTIKEIYGNKFGERISQGLAQRSEQSKQATKELLREKYYARYNALSDNAKQQFHDTLSNRNKKWHSVKTTADEQSRKEKANITRWKNIHSFEHTHNCIVKKTLIAEYGQGWFALNLPTIKDGVNTYISKDFLKDIQAYSSQSQRSEAENIILQLLETLYNGEILTNTRRVISPYELDLYIPSLSLAIEYNGTHWHSIEHCPIIDKHLNKSLLCREKDIRLIHIYEFEDFNKQLSLLKSLLQGTDNYPIGDFNKNNLLPTIPEPMIIYKDDKHTIYGAGKLY